MIFFRDAYSPEIKILIKQIEQEPIPLHTETTIKNEVVYDGTIGRASVTQPLPSYLAPRTVRHNA